MNRLREIREEKFLSQGELAKTAGVSPQTIYRIENNKVKPHGVVIRAIAKALGVKPQELV